MSRDPLAAVARQRGASEPVEQWVEATSLGAGCAATLRHVRGVAAFAAATFADGWGLPAAVHEQLRIACHVHDIAAAVDRADYVGIAAEHGWPVSDVEARVPMLLHQRVSALVAERYGGVDDPEVLHAVAHHTTLEARPSQLLRLLWVSDKMAWDLPGRPPYRDACSAALARRDVAAAISSVLAVWDVEIPEERRHPLLEDAIRTFLPA